MKHYIRQLTRVLVDFIGMTVIAIFVTAAVAALVFPPGSMDAASVEVAATAGEASPVAEAAPTDKPENVRVVGVPVAEAAEPLYTEAELDALALTIAGETFDDEIADKRNVAWVVCNRIADGWGADALEVVSDTRYAVQFVGYWEQARGVTESDREIAAEVLTAFYNGEDAPHGWLYFSGGGGRVNEYK